ncbi:MAG: hypothetical protein F6K37_39410 [Moorea sp. SIO4E2]|uniref:hypothetical protein n=1 Tax=Moorena sp. SIO4E2 TaxID=2607826 RepID=UPI0013B9FC3B|nr:hypothetical protein [Moorena sp. SIO4E2]NEQ11726.1 hypothetical protein [Moorena sp. SIO4E2]
MLSICATRTLLEVRSAVSGQRSAFSLCATRTLREQPSAVSRFYSKAWHRLRRCDA